MQWLTIVLIGVAANIDNLGISVSYGLKSNRIPFLPNLLIAFISMVCAFVSISAGSFLSNFLSQSIANFVGGSLIIGIGVWVIATSTKLFPDTSTLNTTSRSTTSRKVEKEISRKETFLLGFVLAINCLTSGFGAGITGISSLSASLSIGVFSMISISLGVILGNKIGNTLFGKHSNRIAGLLLIIIGIYEMII